MTIILIILVVTAGLLFIVLKRPDEFNVTRSMSMNAPAEEIFALVNDLQQWERWSPWAKLASKAKTDFMGPQAGVGATMRWYGNAKMGTGSMIITESRPCETILMRLDFLNLMRLDFLEPMKAVKTASFHFRPLGVHTEVTWGMHGTSNFMGKVMGLITNCDTMVGGQLEKGLVSLKAIAEA